MLRVLEIDGDALPEYDAELTLGDKAVGRVTSAARNDVRVVALGYVRVEVPRATRSSTSGPRHDPATLAPPRP